MPPPTSEPFTISYDNLHRPVTVPSYAPPLLSDVQQTPQLPPTYAANVSSVWSDSFAALLSPLICDSGASHILLRASTAALLSHIYSPATVSPETFTLPDGSFLQADTGGILTFPGLDAPVSCYVVPDSILYHNLFAVAPLLRPDGQAVFTNTDVKFYSTDTAVLPFLSGHKLPADNLWSITVPPPHLSQATALLTTSPTIPQASDSNIRAITIPPSSTSLELPLATLSVDDIIPDSGSSLSSCMNPGPSDSRSPSYS